MKKEDVQKLRHGVYEIFWKTGGSSLASVGSLHSGKRWLAPCNWTSNSELGIATENWDDVLAVRELQPRRDFTSHVQSLAAWEIVDALVSGLEREWVKVNMGFYAQVEEGVCVGCAATNAICQISGSLIPVEFFSTVSQRSEYLNTSIDFLSRFELALEYFRMGDILGYNIEAAKIGVALISFEGASLPPLTQGTWRKNLKHYRLFATFLREKMYEER